MTSVNCEADSSDIEDIKFIQNLIKHDHISSLPELISALPAQMRSTFNLMYDSESLQAATAQDPRVILSSPTSRLVLTFNGSEAQRGGSSIEAMEYSDSEKNFKFYDITFGKTAKVSAANPQTCTVCHGNDPRPLWQPYRGPDFDFSQWPGAYGSHDDNMTDKEKEQLAQFIKNAKLNDRYKSLLWRGGIENSQPNAALTQRLNTLAIDRMADRIKKTPFYSEYKYAILGAIVCDKTVTGVGNLKFKDFFPKENDFQKVSIPVDPSQYETYFSSIRALFHSRGVNTDLWFLQKIPTELSSLGTPALFTILPADLANGDPDLLKFLEPIKSQSYDGSNFTYTDIKRDLGKPVSFGDDSNSLCSDLRNASIRALSRLNTDRCDNNELGSRIGKLSGEVQKATEHLMSMPVPPPKALNICITCHVSTGFGPSIPFNSPIRLRAYFSGNVGRANYDRLIRKLLALPNDPTRMPPNEKLSDSEKASVINYFNSLISLK